MKGDFSRDSFDPRKRYSRVLMQMGRVLTDADWNEQADIVLQHLRALAQDIFGQHGGSGNGFRILPMLDNTGKLTDIRIASGRYYVNGILCVNSRPFAPKRGSGSTYFDQPYFPLDPQELEDDFKIPDVTVTPFLVYLDVWERLITSIEDPAIREVALGGPDTATRTQVAWQVKLLPLKPSDTDINEITCLNVQNTKAWEDNIVTPMMLRGALRAKAQEARPADISDPCNISPDARYRGTENQLYRVEIHHGGQEGEATFKWSRDNGSVVFPVIPVAGVAGSTISVAHVGRDSRTSLRIGDWVELVDDDYVLHNEARPLMQVQEVDTGRMKVTVKPAPTGTVGQREDRHPLLRRWDHKAGDKRMGGLTIPDPADGGDGAALVVEEAGPQAGWLALEDGIYIKFEPGANYHTGDYWIIEARTVTGDINWPRENGVPAALPPHGVAHFYAPLASISLNPNNNNIAAFDLRHFLAPAACRPDNCPTIDFSVTENGDGTFNFTAIVSGGTSSAFNWTVTNGTPATATGATMSNVKRVGNNQMVVKVKCTFTGAQANCRNMATLIL